MGEFIKRNHSQKLPNGQPKVSRRVQSLYIENNNKTKPRHSITGIQDLVQCGICLEELVNPRMLECQHTCCLNCLQSNFAAKKILAEKQNKTTPMSIKCNICEKITPLEKGLESIKELSENMYINSLIEFVKGNMSPPTQKTIEYKCIKCQIVNANPQICQHCSQLFCKICWNDHILELNHSLSNLTKQLGETGRRLEHKIDNYNSHCDQLKDTVTKSIEEQIEGLRSKERKLINELEAFKVKAKKSADDINENVEKLKKKIKNEAASDSANKDANYKSLHKETSAVLNEVVNFGETKVIFDSETLKLDVCTEGIFDDDYENDPDSSLGPVVDHYKTRTFTPKLKWERCPRPAGVAISPWDPSKLLIAATDSRSVLVMNRDRKKLIGKITNNNFHCPVAIAFSKKRLEMYISDKWANCIHVFSHEEEYIRTLCKNELKSPDGIAYTNDSLAISDSGHNRIIFVNPESGAIIKEITGLNNPNGIAVNGDNIIVADTGNHRIKTFDINGKFIQEFGSLGKNPGQFRFAEVVAVDHLGFILVGDGGNARIQVFSPDGKVIRIFGSKEGFGWVSGLVITSDLDIVATDHKNRCLTIF